jgi:fucose permease
MNMLRLMTIVGLLATGVGVALLGSVKLALARKLKIDEARVGGMVSVFGFAMIPVMLTVGFVTDLVGKQPVVIGGSLLMTGSLVLLAWSSTYWPALLAVLLLSAGWATLINVINPISLFAFPGSEAYALNLACFFFGLGAFVTPLIVAYLVRRLRLRGTLLVLAGFVLLTAVLGVAVDFSTLTQPPTQAAATVPTGGSIATLLRDAMLWLCAFALFFYAPLEATMGAWATTYLGDKGVSEGSASGLLSAFWLLFTGSRLATALALPKGSETALVLALSVVCIAVWTTVVFSRRRGMAIGSVVVAGLVFGPIFPTVMALLLGHFPRSLHGRAVGLFFAIGGLGWTAIPMLIGAYAQRTSIQRGFVMAAASAVGLCAIALALLLSA